MLWHHPEPCIARAAQDVRVRAAGELALPMQDISA